MSTRTKPSRGGRTRHGGTRRTTAPTPSGPSVFWPIVCGTVAAALIFLVAAGYWSPSASVTGAPLRPADGAIAVGAALLLAAATGPVRARQSSDGR